MLDVVVTRATFHPPMFWLKRDAPLKALATVITDATFHLPMSALNVGWLANNWFMLLTAAVFQSAMLPYVETAAVGFIAHAVTAVPMFVFVMAVSACAHGRIICAITATAAQRRQLTLGSREAARRRHERRSASPATSTAVQKQEHAHAVPKRIRLGIRCCSDGGHLCSASAGRMQ
jgi:hypothetical protein